MNWISNFFSRYWRNVHFLSIVLVAFGFIYAHPPVNSVVAQSTITVFYYPFYRIKSAVVDLTTVKEENRRLNEKLVNVSMMLSNLEEAKLENSRLRDVLGFKPPPDYSLLPAKVISISGSPVPLTAVINRGAIDSVMINQPVINEDGLIGRVIEVTDEFAIVQLLTDPANRVASRLQRSRDMGIAKYKVNQGMILDNVPVQGDVNVGDAVLSSGLGQVYPAELRVGRVLSVERPTEGTFCLITLMPATNFGRIDELFVLRAHQP